jgi:hypothetical protein
LYSTINILIAEFIVEKLMLRTPSYIEQYIAKQTGTVNVKCTLLTPYANIEEQGDSTVVSAAKAAAIALAVAVILCYLLMVVVHIVRATSHKGNGDLIDNSDNKENTKQ